MNGLKKQAFYFCPLSLDKGTHFLHWSLTHMSRAFLADTRKRLWRDELCPPGRGLAGMELLDQESRLTNESRDE